MIEQITFCQAFAAQSYELRLMAPTEVVGTTTATVQTPCWNQAMAPVALKRLLRSTTRNIHHTVITGLQIAHWSVLGVFTPQPAELGRGIVLDGSAPTGAMSLGIWNPTANVATCMINWCGSEYTVR